ncbi:hypothetical protein BDW74DRAFT_160031 [Aspergillus multicolor]|uniref:uncharacterized protein n=1 Tax=Aspergillus multicolor TaxID=41759 RepID=UPI003CCD4486
MITHRKQTLSSSEFREKYEAHVELIKRLTGELFRSPIAELISRGRHPQQYGQRHLPPSLKIRAKTEIHLSPRLRVPIQAQPRRILAPSTRNTILLRARAPARRMVSGSTRNPALTLTRILPTPAHLPLETRYQRPATRSPCSPLK